MNGKLYRLVTVLSFVAANSFLLARLPLLTESGESLEARIQKLMDRPEFRHGIEFLLLDMGRPVFAVNQDKLFTPRLDHQVAAEGTLLESTTASTLASRVAIHYLSCRSG